MILLGVVISYKSDAPENDGTRREKEISAFLEKSAAIENVSVKLCFSEDGRVTGAAVVCERGNDARVQKEVIGFLTVLLGLGAHQVYVSGG